MNKYQLKSIDSVNQEINQIFKSKIHQTNQALCQMRAGGRLKVTGVFSPSIYVQPQDETNNDEKVQQMLDNIHVKADSTTKIFKQYDKLMKCLQFKDEIKQKYKNDQRNKSVIEHVDTKDLFSSNSVSKESLRLPKHADILANNNSLEITN